MSRRGAVLALRALGLGDFLTGLPALRALRRAFPGRRLVLAAPAWLGPLAAHAGAADELLPAAPLARLRGAPARVEVAVNLHGRGPQSHRVLTALGPRRLIAFAHPAIPSTAGMPRYRADEHEVHRWCRLLSGCGIPADPSELDIAPPDRPVPDGACGATLVHPGAASPARRWPVERWAEVVRAELARGRRVVLTGSFEELPLAAAVARLAGLGPEAVLAGRTDVLDLAALVAAAGRVVCTDTGVAHLATALGTPSVVLFGPVPPALWGPPPGRRQHVVLWAGMTGDPHGTNGPDPSVLAITVGQVDAALARLEERAGHDPAEVRR